MRIGMLPAMFLSSTSAKSGPLPKSVLSPLNALRASAGAIFSQPGPGASAAASRNALAWGCSGMLEPLFMFANHHVFHIDAHGRSVVDLQADPSALAEV